MNSNVFGHIFTGFFGLWFLFILSLFVCTGIQQALRSRAPHPGHADGEMPACDVAYLSGGPHRALLSALTALKLAELVQVDDRTVRAIGRARPELDELQRAVLAATTAPVPRSQLANRRGVAAALAAIEKRLVEQGLLLSDRRRRLVRLAGIIPLVVAVAVLVRTVQAMVQTGSAFHVLFGLGAVVVVLFQFRRAPRRTRRGDRTVGELRQQHHAPGARLGSGRYTDDATGAAFSVGIDGNEAVRGCDPGLADALCLPQSGDGGGGIFGGGDSWGSSGGSDSGGGWHSGSSWDSGSSWSSGGSDGGSSSSSDSSSSSSS
jgi:uncharacterized protein (TIGR04222 family)